MPPEKKLRLIQLLKRKAVMTASLPGAFPEQQRFLIDRSKFKVVLCTRRAGKSFAIGLELYNAALRNPGSTVLYLGLTRESAKRVLWKDIIYYIEKFYGLNSRLNHSELSVHLHNGSQIIISGADATEKEKEKLLGQKYAYVAIDEAQSFTTDLKSLVFDTLLPACADLGGTICLIGTPTYTSSGLFYELTKGQDPTNPGTWQVGTWIGHRWSWKENTTVRDAIERQLNELQIHDPGYFDTSDYRRNYLGQWSLEDIPRVYHGFRLGRNEFDLLPPPNPHTPWINYMGVDLGYNDPSAIVVASWRKNDPNLYIREAWEHQGALLDAVADKVKVFQNQYKVSRIVVDGASKQAVETMRVQYKIPFEIAQKQKKRDRIEAVNTAFEAGRLMIHRTNCTWDVKKRKNPNDPDSLQKELLDLVWDRHDQEHPGIKNDACDAMLYLIGICGHVGQRAPEKLAPEDEMFKMHVQSVKRQKIINSGDPTASPMDQDWGGVWDNWS